MKIAVAVETNTSDAPVSRHAARAPCYLVFNEAGVLIDTITNPYSSVERGAAPRVAQLMQENQVNTLVAGEFGDRFIDLLQEKHIATEIAQGTVSSIIKTLIN